MPARLLVIDTQSLLDWLVFRDRICDGWAERLGAGDWKWIFTSDMWAEFRHVASRGFGPRWPVPPDLCADAWARYGHEVDPPGPPGSARLPCTDPDDQKFIDLALAHPASVLVTRDKALLRLARRAARLGTTVCPPAAWTD